VWLLTFDEAGRSPRDVAAAGVDPAVVERLPLPRAVGEGRPDFLPTRREVRDRIEPMLEAVPGVGSAALLPLVADGRCLGVLGVGFEHEQALSAEDRGYLAALAGVSSLALARAAA
jgi:GAF domain-containing protein